MRLVNENLPADTPLYIYIEDLSVLEYGLFGINRTRELYPVANPQDAPSGAALLIAKERMGDLPPGFSLIAEDEGYWLVARK